MDKILAKKNLIRFRHNYHNMSQKARMNNTPFTLAISAAVFGINNLPKTNFTNSTIRNNIKGLPCIIFGKQLVLKIIDELLE